MKLSELPPLGQALAAGIFAGLTTTADGKHHAVVLLADKPTGSLNWQAANAWADGIQAALPTRAVAALLYANLRAQFEPEWYWSCEVYDGSFAWTQFFDDGTQLDDFHKSFEGRARAVRRFPA